VNDQRVARRAVAAEAVNDPGKRDDDGRDDDQRLKVRHCSRLRAVSIIGLNASRNTIASAKSSFGPQTR
jgi:hypothetical protein